MDDLLCRRFFLEPTQTLRRRYAALRAFFVDGLTPQTIAQRFGLAYHTVRSWVRDFRAQCQAGQIPPFSLSRIQGGHPVPTRTGHRLGRTNQPPPTAGNCG